MEETRTHFEESPGVGCVEFQFCGDLSEEQDLNAGSTGVPQGTTDTEFVGHGGGLEAAKERKGREGAEEKRSARRPPPLFLSLSRLEIGSPNLQHYHESCLRYSQSSGPCPSGDDSLFKYDLKAS